ncbi:MAG TPA: hypothetical protein VGN01_05290 [Acidobacteriaceae bacterium]|jgi:hypothetical protein
MKQLLIAVLLALPSLAYSQAVPFEQDPPVVSITGGGSYIYGEYENGHHHNLFGWSVAPAFNITRRLGLQTEFANLRVSSVSPTQHRLLMTAGPRYNFVPRFHARPFVFGEAGEMRLTSGGSPFRDWDPIAKVGFGFDYKLSRPLSLTVVPVEYLAHNLDAGGWDHDYAARVGFTLNFYSIRHIR